MKTTIDLPDDLVRELKFRAVHDRRKLKDLAADLLRTGLATAVDARKKESRPVVLRDKTTGLPTLQGRRTPPRNQPTPDQIHAILLMQEAEWAHASS